MILHMQLASLLKQQDRHCSELLGERTDAKLGLWHVGHMLIPMSHTVALV